MESIFWRSLNEAIASVDSLGQVTGEAPGTTEIEIGYLALSIRVPVTVSAIAWEPGDLTINSVVVSNTTPEPADSVTFTVTIGNPSAKNLPLTLRLTPIAPSGARGATVTRQVTSGFQSTFQVSVGPVTIQTGSELGPYDVEVVLEG